MGRRNLSLTQRSESIREQRPVMPPVHFTLDEIKSHFDDSLDSIKNQYLVADSLLESGNIEGCKTIWRSQIVLAEGLLDFYIHEISKYCLYWMFEGQLSKTEKYNSLLIPMSKVEKGISAIESKEWFFEYLNDRFCKDVFLSGESMKDQLNLIGVTFEKVMYKAFPSDTINDSQKIGKQIVKELFQRRNEIAHQNDRSHYTAEQNDIDKEFVEKYIDNIVSIVCSIHDIAVENSKVNGTDD